MIASGILILSAFLVATKADILDFATLYRFSKDNGSLTVTKEYHRQNNALGMLLKQNGDYIDSVNGMSPLGCIIASAKCTWNKEGEWSVKNTTSLNDLNYTIPLQDAESGSCDINNGGCQVFCTMENSKPFCSCPSYFSLTVNGKDCYPDRSSSNMFTNSSGKFAFRDSGRNAILIVAPPNATIELNYTSYGHRYYIYEYYPSGNTRSQRQYSSAAVKYLSTSEIVYIYTDGYCSGEYVIRRPTLTLESAAGALTLPVPPLAPALCVSVMYRPATPDDDLRMAATLPDASVVDFTDSHTKKIGSWINSRFEATLPEYDTNSPVLLSVFVSGAGTELYSIAGCSPYGKVDITVVGTVPWSSVSRGGASGDSSETNEEGEQKCFNGGEYIEDAEQCNCPSGFMGPRCEEGCGPNRFGSDCGATCSHFAAACSGILFCKDRLPCLCAPGYKGHTCDESCRAGYYGASCRRSCGKCTRGTCDQFTGICEDGCLPGYAPPLCQDTHKYIGSGLAIVNKDFTLATVQADVSEAKGQGDAIFYQLQYKEQSSYDWLEMQPEKMSGSVISTNLTGLNAGHTYEVRVVLIDKDGSSYDGEKVAVAKFTTFCKVPTSREYDLKILEATNVSCIVSWKYEGIENECPVSGYEVILEKNWQRMKSTVPPDTNSFRFSGLLSGESYSVTVQALSQRGRAPASAALAVTTHSSAPGLVTNLVVSRSGESGLEVAWKKPRYTAGEIQEYVVEYKCVRLLACPEDPCERRKLRPIGFWAYEPAPCEDPCYSNRSTVAIAAAGPPRAALNGLLAHASYRVAVRARAAELGKAAVAHATTQDSGPSAPPQPADPPAAGASVTNSSVSFRWRPPKECALLGGYLRGYRLELRLAAAGAAWPPLRVATTSATNATLEGLQPQTEYSVRVFAETSGGWSPQHGLEIVAKTAATAPEAVLRLEVYKRGRRALGLRWAAPHRSYGPIRSFSVALSREGSQEEPELLTASVDASSRCSAWPELFCHTVQGPPLAPGQRYRVTVRARNQLVEAEGLPATVAAETREQTPGRPEALTATPRGPRAVLLRWQPPSLFNGLLRSFLLTVEQTDALEPASCCADFPVREMPVRAEQPAYEFEVTELSPAASYVFSVSAKTLAIGPGASVALSTGPEPPALQPPQLIETGSDSALLTLEPAVVAPAAALDGGYILLVLPRESEAEDYPGDEGEPGKAEGEQPRRGAVLSSQLAEQLADQLAAVAANVSFYVAREFPLGELPAEVRVGSGARQAPPGPLSSPWDPPLAPDAEHRVALALALRYRGAASVAVAVGEPFATEG